MVDNVSAFSWYLKIYVFAVISLTICKQNSNHGGDVSRGGNSIQYRLNPCLASSTENLK